MYLAGTTTALEVLGPSTPQTIQTNPTPVLTLDHGDFSVNVLLLTHDEIM